MARSGASRKSQRLRARRLSGRAAATTPLPTRRGRLKTNDSGNALAAGGRLPAAAVAQSLFALAHGDLLGDACRRDHVRPVLEVRLDAAAGIAAVSALGR